jgi:hypothetical protein
MARYRDDGEVQIDNSTKVHFRNAFQQLIMIAALNVGTLLTRHECRTDRITVDDQGSSFFSSGLFR